MKHQGFKCNSVVHFCLLLLMLCMSGQISVQAAAQETVSKPKEPLPLEELSAFTEAYYQLKSSYIRPVDDVTLLRAAIQGMVSSLDEHSRFMPPEEFMQFNNDNQGEYAGIGLSFNEHEYGIEVALVIPNSPAARAGIEVGMIVTHINQQSLKFIPAREALDMLVGDVGAQVELTVAAAQFAKPKTIPLTLEVILLPSISSEMLPNNIGYIRINQFTSQSVIEFRQAINQLVQGTGEQGSDDQSSKNHNTDSHNSNAENGQMPAIKHLIIDLRDNLGGVMEIAVELADLFVEEGKLLISKGRIADANEIYYAHEDTPLLKTQVVLVINGHSASASEIFAAALQDHHRATIIGEKSYGKGSIQSVVALNQTSGMKFTTAEYFSPLGHKIQDVGVKPDITFNTVDSSVGSANIYNVSLLDDPQLLQAYNLALKH